MLICITTVMAKKLSDCLLSYASRRLSRYSYQFAKIGGQCNNRLDFEKALLNGIRYRSIIEISSQEG